VPPGAGANCCISSQCAFGRKNAQEYDEEPRVEIQDRYLPFHYFYGIYIKLDYVKLDEQHASLLYAAVVWPGDEALCVLETRLDTSPHLKPGTNNHVRPEFQSEQ
jgi:hypothetical protein